MNAVVSSFRMKETLHAARFYGASDVHLAAGMPAIFRLAGKLETQRGYIFSPDDLARLLKERFSDEERARLDESGDMTVAEYDDASGPFRVHAYKAGEAYSVAIRLLSSATPTMAALALPAIGRFIEHEHGLILFTGPTGSGKSTAMAAMIDAINERRAAHVMTIEDPIEYRYESKRSLISQRQIGRDAIDFRHALMGALRSDPDVILVGEMRDRATIEATLTAAETGHLVLTTLHTGTASEAVDRIIGVFGGDAQQQIRLQLAQTLVAVVSLRLVARKRGDGRQCVAEILVATDAVRSLIRESKTHQLRNIIATSRSSGMQTLEAHVAELRLQDVISEETAAQFGVTIAKELIPEERNGLLV